MPSEDTYLFMTYFGIASGVSKIVIGEILDHFRNVRFLNLYISQLCIVGFGISTILICFTSSYHSFLLYYIFFGMFDAGFIGQQCSIVLKSIDHEEQLPLAWGVFSLLSSFPCFIGGPLGGEQYTECLFMLNIFRERKALTVVRLQPMLYTFHK